MYTVEQWPKATRMGQAELEEVLGMGHGRAPGRRLGGCPVNGWGSARVVVGKGRQYAPHGNQPPPSPKDVVREGSPFHPMFLPPQDPLFDCLHSWIAVGQKGLRG